jgi:hypothetical protein
MPDLDDSAALAAGRTADTEGPAPSRRSVLKGAAGVGAAGIAAGALVTTAIAPASAATKATRTKKTSDDDEATSDDIVVHVRDGASGDIDVYRGTAHIEVHDRALAAHLARISR